MLGQQSPQRELFRPDNIHLDHVGRSTIYGFLAQERHRLFRDQDFADLYRKDWGRPSVPPSQLCIALILQAKDGVSDDEAIQRSAFDLRWKVALGIDVEEKLCAKSTLQLFRAKLVLHDKYQKVFESSIASCRRAGLLKKKKLDVALDTTPIFGRGAVKDTFNLLSDQIVRVVKTVAELKGQRENCSPGCCRAAVGPCGRARARRRHLPAVSAVVGRDITAGKCREPGESVAGCGRRGAVTRARCRWADGVAGVGREHGAGFGSFAGRQANRVDLAPAGGER